VNTSRLLLNALLIAAVLACATTGWSGAEDVVPAAPSTPKPLAKVFEMERRHDTDLLVLVDGDHLAGTILNKTFTLKTAYAQLKLDKHLLAGIDLNKAGRAGDSLVTVNSNQFSGLLEDPFFLFDPQTGSRAKVRREKVRRAIFRVQEEELKGIPNSRWIRLKNGDWCSGQLLPGALTFTTTGGPVPLSLIDIASLTFGTNAANPMTVILNNGQTLYGSLALEDLTILLDVGIKLNVYKDYLVSIRTSPDSPPELLVAAVPPADLGAQGVPAAKSALTNQVPAGTAAPGAVASSSNSTNVEGMVWIPAGQFTMGSPLDEPGRDQDEGPPTRVTIPQGFWIGKCEVTQAEYLAIIGTNPSLDRGDLSRPVEKVNWYEAMEYCARLTRQQQEAGRLPAGFFYRLPTEAEWEYACRAGTTTRFSYGDDKGELHLGDYAWFARNSQSATHPVASRQPNPWGLYDMHGNVWEWCLDRWESSLLGGSITNSPISADGTLRAARGGSWLYEAKACRSANRDDYGPSNRCSDVGFRVVLAPSQP
jgi:formylglycine-generating enzyme required for sulfatase activity